MSTTSELGHLAMPINFHAQEEKTRASFEPETSRFRVLRSARCATLTGQCGPRSRGRQLLTARDRNFQLRRRLWT